MSSKFKTLLSRRGAMRLFGVGSLAFVASEISLIDSSVAAPTARVAFLGDSMIDGVWASIKRDLEHDACLKQAVTTGRYAENGAGLARADKFHWPEKAAKIMADFKPDLVITSIGLNDRQGVVDPDRNVRVEFDSPDWEPRYREQVDAFIKNSSSGRAGIIWLGLPILRDKEAQDDAAAKNKIFRQTIEAIKDPKIVYLEPWRVATTEGESFQAYLTDTSGSKQQIRTPDGIHFTRAGYDLIASYVYPKIIAHLKKYIGSELACDG